MGERAGYLPRASSVRRRQGRARIHSGREWNFETVHNFDKDRGLKSFLAARFKDYDLFFARAT